MYSTESLRQQVILDYDTKKYPFREAIVAILQDDCRNENIDELPSTDLSTLHRYKEHKCSTHFVDRSGHEMSFFQTKWNQNRDRMGEAYKKEKQDRVSDNYKYFESIYLAFIKEVIGPSMGGGDIYYQRAPTFRMYLPTKTPMGKLHKDEEYHHQPSEINVWLPISDHVGNNNSLWVETKPNAGDFAPINIEYGQFYRGYLNQCMHYTNANDTDYTRVSIDFRVVNENSGGHDPKFHKGINRGAKALFQKKFDVGGFYNVLQS